MEYEITTVNASQLIETIFDCVANGLDPQENRIETWNIRRIGGNQRYLIHTTDQWEQKGCLELQVKNNSDNRVVKIIFHYWRDFPNNERNGKEDKYYLGRFTELMLVHFENMYQRIKVE